MKRALVVLATLLAVTFGVTAPAHSAEPAVAAERPKVPAFRLKDLKGKKMSIKSLKGKVVMISFWATWCVPCKRELDDLAKLYKTEKDKGLEVLAIATDGPETYSAIRGVVKRRAIELIIRKALNDQVVRLRPELIDDFRRIAPLLTDQRVAGRAPRAGRIARDRRQVFWTKRIAPQARNRGRVYVLRVNDRNISLATGCYEFTNHRDDGASLRHRERRTFLDKRALHVNDNQRRARGNAAV